MMVSALPVNSGRNKKTLLAWELQALCQLLYRKYRSFYYLFIS